MHYTKKIICLASSRKPPLGRCIAGKEILAGNQIGGWIRPVSSRPGCEISEEEREYENGKEPSVLDIISIEMLTPAPKLHQTENHLIDPSFYWASSRAFPKESLLSLLDNPSSLWLNTESSRLGRNDRIHITQAASLNNSLYLIEPENLIIHVHTEGQEYDNPRKRVRAEFEYNGASYKFLVSDPDAERQYRQKAEGSYPLNDVCLTISLTEPYEVDNKCYKVVAAIIQK